MITRAEIGTLGEDAAQEYLLREGFKLQQRNWRYKYYELDFVATKKGVLHIIEVRTRKLGGLTTPEFSYSRTKFAHLLKAVQAYVRYYKIEYDVQFDLIAVDHQDGKVVDLRYIPNATFYRSV